MWKKRIKAFCLILLFVSNIVAKHNRLHWGYAVEFIATQIFPFSCCASLLYVLGAWFEIAVAGDVTVTFTIVVSWGVAGIT